MRETEKLRQIFSILFCSIMVMLFVTISSFVGELYEVHKKEKELIIKKITESLEINTVDLQEEVYMGQFESTKLRIESILDSLGVEKSQIGIISNGKCINLSANSECKNELLQYKKLKTKTLNVQKTGSFSIFSMPIMLFNKIENIILIKISNEYTSVNRLEYILTQILPLLLLFVGWFCLYRYVEANVITPQINKIAEFESNKKFHDRMILVAHDLRAPVSFITQVVDRLEQSDERELLSMSSTRINDIVENCLEDIKIAKNNDRIFCLESEVSNLVCEFMNRFKSVEIKLKNSMSKKVYLSNIHKQNLVRSMSNLISNAIESQSFLGIVTIDMESLNSYINIVISDDGCGVPVEIQDKVLSGFSTKEKGNGLGLSSALSWAESVEGSLKFVKKSKGASLKLSLPLSLFQARMS